MPETFVTGYLPTLPYDERAMPKTIVRNPGLTVQVRGLSVQTDNTRIPTPAISLHGINRS